MVGGKKRFMKRKGQTFIKRFFVACAGISETFRREKSFRLQTAAAVTVLLFCLIAQPPIFWCAIFAAMVALVLSLELVNSAIEALLDKFHPEYSEEIGFAKDCLAGAVLVASIAAASIFGLYVLDHYLN